MTEPTDRPRLLVGSMFPRKVGEETVALYCDECGALPPCAHRDEKGRDRHEIIAPPGGHPHVG